MKFALQNKFLKKLWQSQIFRHIFYWICGFVFFFLNVIIWDSFANALLIGVIVIVPGIIPVYLHFYLHKRFFKRRQYLPYILFIILILIASQFCTEGIIRLIEKDADTHTSGAATAFVFIIFTTTLQYYKKGVKQQVRLQEAEAKQLQTELALLRSQVNPHFFFNTLNNLYALSLDKSEKVPDVILKISELMRYILESSKNKKVALTQEIEFVKNYLALEKLRLSVHSDISLNLSGTPDEKTIAPMLLIPFVENSFKHGISASTTPNYVYIDLKIKGNDLFFSIENNKRESYKTKDLTSSKSGLKNVVRRLELIYPDKHQLDINENKTSYKVNLKIRL